MSGLLPRTTENQQDGSFTSLTVQNLTVSLVGYINSLVANTLSIGTFVIDTFSANVANVITANVTTTNVSNVIDVTTAVGQGITINCTNGAITNNELAFEKAGVYGGSVGLNQITNETYLWSQNALKLGSGATERIKIPSGGIATDNTTTSVLALQGTTLVSKNNLVDTSTAQAFSNKTIDSATNTLTITNSPLVAANVNTLINQDVRTTASPAFQSATLGNQLTLNTGAFHPIIVNQSSNTSGNDILFQKLSANIFATGTNEQTNETYSWTYAARDYKIGTSSTERLRILSTGIATDNSAATILALQGTTLVSRDNIVDTITSQALSNKTLNSPVISTITNTGTLTLPTTTGTLALTSDIPSLANYVTTNTAQNITAAKTFTVAPVISTITNTGTLTLPTTTGTLALTSQIPTNTSYVDLTTNQSIGGVKTFTSAPVISTITNTGTLTLPTGPQTLVGRTTNDVFSNKTINSATNTLTITNSPLVAVNVNSLINQDVRTTANVLFNAIDSTTTVAIGTYRFTDRADQQYYDVIDSSGSPLIYSEAIRQTIAAGAVNTVIWSYAYGPDNSLMVDFMGTGFNAANNGSGAYHYSNNFRTVSGVVSNTGTLYTDKKETGAPYGGKLSITFGVSGTNMQMYASNSAAFPISLSGVVKQYLTR